MKISKSSSTKNFPNEISWWSVDLEKEYEIEKVCILNIDDMECK